MAQRGVAGIGDACAINALPRWLNFEAVAAETTCAPIMPRYLQTRSVACCMMSLGDAMTSTMLHRRACFHIVFANAGGGRR